MTGISFGTNEFIIGAIFAIVLVIVFFTPSKPKNKNRKDD